jgi:two-component system cell cycle sensor histidine kinase/response regulator CckA
MTTALGILLVEDSPTDVLLAQEALDDRSQFEVTVADRLGSALGMMWERSFDIVLLDLGLPDSQGLDTLVRLRQKHPVIPVIVMTARDDEKMALQAVQHGSQDYLVKSQLQEGMLARAIRYAIERDTAKQTLQERELLFRAAFEHTGVGMVLTDPDNRFLRVNDSFARMFGYEPTEMVGMTMAEVTHPEDVAESLRSRARLIADESTFFQLSKRYLHRDGHIFWGRTNVSLVRDTALKPLYYVGQVQDVTEQKRAESERDRLFQESLSLLGILHFDGSFQQINPAWERTLGYTREELVGEPFMKLVHPDDRAGSLAQVKRMAGGVSIPSFEGRLRCKDGTYRSFLWNGSPLLDRSAFSVSGHDITEKKRADEALRLRDRAMQSVSQGLVIADACEPDHPIVYASPGFLRMTGYMADEVMGRNCRFLQGAATDQVVLARVREAVVGAKPCKEEILNYRKDGTSFWNEMSLAPVRDEAGVLTHFVGVQTDVTARRELEEQFRQAQKMEAIGRLAGGVAHDFNNLLTIINGYGELLLNDLPDNDPARDLIREIVSAGERAAGLTRQLLAFSRKAVIEPRTLDLKAVVANIDRMLRRIVGEDIEFTVVADPQVGAVRADLGQIEQVIMNLVVNARDAMPRGGRIKIELRNAELDDRYAQSHVDARLGPHVLLAVSDSGCGMDTATISHIFEPFFSTKGDQGTGLGLATVHGIVRQAGGHIAVDSEVGLGATFKIFLPCSERTKITSNSRGDIVTPPRGGETILLVEDETGVRALTSLILRNCGYTVLEARDGVEGVEVAKQHTGRIDLMVTDVVMPRMGGREVAAKVTHLHPSMKVLFLSGYTDDAIVHHGVLEAEVAFLQKPFTPSSLGAKVRRILDDC